MAKKTDKEKHFDSWCDSAEMDIESDVAVALRRLMMKFPEIPAYESQACPKGKKCKKCKKCKGTGIYRGKYRGQIGIELICPEVAKIGFTKEQWKKHSDNKLGVPVGIERMRQFVETRVWKVWSLEGIYEAKYYKTIEGKDVVSEVQAAEAKFGQGSVVRVLPSGLFDENYAIFIKNDFWNSGRGKKGRKKSDTKKKGRCTPRGKS